MRGKNCTKDEAFCKPSKSMSYTHRLVNRHLSNCDGVIVLLLSCLRCVCIAGEALRRPPRPLPLVTAFVGKRTNWTMLPPTDSSTYTREFRRINGQTVTRALALLFSCVCCVCMAGEVLRPPPRPLPLGTAVVSHLKEQTREQGAAPS